MDNPFEFHEEDAIIACVGENGGTTDEDIRNGFKRTVELLTESLKDGQEVEDLLVYPIVYNARHSIELSLKIVIKMLWEIEGKKGIKYSDEIIAERKKKIHTHNIEELYKMACENKNIDRRIPAYFENIEDMIRFYYFDEEGDAFKYELNKENQPHMIKNKISHISIVLLETEFKEVMEKFDQMMDYVARIYIKSLNAIHYMHDKYCYEAIEMALHDKDIIRTMACGIAGLSVVADSLSAIKYAKVKVIRDETGLATDFEIEGDFPKFGNDDDKVDSIAVDIVKTFVNKLRKHPTYRNSKHTLSILTITSNVVYGKATGNTPDGRRAGAPFGPGANPLHGRDTNGALAVMNSIAKLPFDSAEDGISYTFSITPGTLGKDEDQKITNLVNMLDGYFAQTGHHINVNVFDRSLLLDAMDHPEKYPQLTIRVSGYAVNFVKLTREQQLDVINRTIHEKI